MPGRAGQRDATVSITGSAEELTDDARACRMPTERNVEVLRQLLDGFNRHDLDAVMSCFAAECVFEAPRGPDPARGDLSCPYHKAATRVAGARIRYPR